MKKITFFLTTTALSCLFANFAAADSYKYSPYIGVDYLYNHTSASYASPDYNALGLHIGSDYSKYFATELFFNQSDNNKRNFNEHKLKTSYHSFGLDILAFLPLGCEQRFSLFATTGIGQYAYRHKITGNKHFNSHGRGYRFGGGAKYAFDEHWQIRFIARHTHFDNVDFYNHAMDYSIGIEYHF